MPQLKLYTETEPPTIQRDRVPSRRFIPSVKTLDDILGPLAVVVDWSDIVHAELDLPSNTIQVTYVPTRRGSPHQVSATFADGATADLVFGNLQECLGPEWKIQALAQPWREQAAVPFGVLVGILLATALIGMAALIAENGQPGASPLSHWDWRWVCGIGGVAAAAVQVWLYRQLTKPPLRLELQRG